MHHDPGILQGEIRFITVTLLVFVSDCCCLCFLDVGGAADKISLIPQDFFAELVSRAINWMWKEPFCLTSSGFCLLQRNFMYVVAQICVTHEMDWSC